jgi:hypothetical protein
MFSANDLVASFARNLHLIHAHLKEFSQTDALQQPPFRSNCALWIVGHLAAYRNAALEHLGLPPTFDATAALRFKVGSAPVLGDEPGLPLLSDLLAALDAAQTQIAAAMPHLDAARAADPVSYGAFAHPIPRAEAIVHLMRHESYHTGQLELLAEMVKGGR